jgi:hypothetical protein
MHGHHDEYGVCCDKYWTHNVFLTFTPEPNAIQLGDPLGCQPWAMGGTSLAFTACQGSSRVRLGTFILFQRTATQDITLHLTAKDRSSNPYFRCPLITLCDAPAYTKQCVSSGEDAIINPSVPVNCPSTWRPDTGSPQLVNVHSANWSAVKSIYR